MDGSGQPTTPGLHRGTSGITATNGERTSIYSATGILGVSERNSFYAKPSMMGGDTASVRSGLFSHTRADSVSGSIGGGVPAGSTVYSPPLMGGPSTAPTTATASPLTSPRARSEEPGGGVTEEEEVQADRDGSK